jgi:hypothetical protein
VQYTKGLRLHTESASRPATWSLKWLYQLWPILISPDVLTGNNWENAISSSTLPPNTYWKRKVNPSDRQVSVNYCAIQHAGFHHCCQLMRKTPVSYSPKPQCQSCCLLTAEIREILEVCCCCCCSLFQLRPSLPFTSHKHKHVVSRWHAGYLNVTLDSLLQQ